MLPRAILGLSLTALTLVAPLAARAADPVLRHQDELHGDVVVFGSTLGYDCGAGLPVPTGATASCADWTYYQASGDATDFVATWGAGDFRPWPWSGSRSRPGGGGADQARPGGAAATRLIASRRRARVTGLTM